MNRKRQKNQQPQAFESKDRGEAPARGDEETEAWRPLCRRPPDSTSRVASSLRAMGSDVFGAQLPISAGAVRSPGCSPGTALRR